MDLLTTARSRVLHVMKAVSASASLDRVDAESGRANSPPYGLDIPDTVEVHADYGVGIKYTGLPTASRF